LLVTCPASLLALVFMMACSSSPLDESRSEFDQAQARWRAAAATDYDFDLQHLCYCADPATRPVTISVRGGVFHSIAYADSGTAADTTWFRDYLTIDRLFALLQRTLDGKPARFTASYHAELGYPDRVDVDPISGAADDEFSLRITKLRPPPP
jgi:hypothetical protein